jgi:hypothetical protein
MRYKPSVRDLRMGLDELIHRDASLSDDNDPDPVWFDDERLPMHCAVDEEEDW